QLANGHEVHIFDHEDGSYLQEADQCSRAFETSPSFADMSRTDRQIVAGFGPSTYGYFGRMPGAGRFKNLVNEAPEEISRHLDSVPHKGNVETAVIEKYLDRMLALKGISLATATRLLVAKRPDRFLPVNGANSLRIRQVFGSSPSTP